MDNEKIEGSRQVRAELETRLLKASMYRGEFFEAERKREVASLLRKLATLDDRLRDGA